MQLLAAPALPLHTAGRYVAAAYIVFFALVLIYVAVMAVRVSRIERELGELLERAPRSASEPAGSIGASIERASAPAIAVSPETAVREESARV